MHMNRSGKQLGGSNFGYLHSHSLQGALEHLAACGMEVVELGLAAPHFDLMAATGYEITSLRIRLNRGS